VLRFQIFTRARKWPILTSAPPTGDGGLPYNFFDSKIGLKCNKGAFITSELGGVARWNFDTWRSSRLGCWRKYNIWGHRPLKIWENKKRPKFSTFYDNFRVWPQISLKPMKIATKSKRRWREGSLRRWTQKILWNSVHYEQSYKRSCWPTLSRQCAFGVYQCIWVRGTWLWCRKILPHP